jgi:hypothetical protein
MNDDVAPAADSESARFISQGAGMSNSEHDSKPRITHSRPISVPPTQDQRHRPSADEPLPVAEPVGPVTGGSKISAFGEKKRHEDSWNRTPNSTGTGAIHVKTFHCKLTDDALGYMDSCINEWLDAHPQYEVKFVTSTVGTLTGKLKEPHLICQIWV